MATQFKTGRKPRLKSLSLVVVTALVITLAPAVSVLAGEVITLTTIMPGQDTLRVKRGAVGLTYKETTNYPDADIGDDNLIIEGNVGIGTTSPGARLDVKAGNLGSTGGIRLIDSASSYVAGYLKSAADGHGIIQLNYQDSARVAIAANGDSYFTGGNVGIGTTNPSKKLEVVGGPIKAAGGLIIEIRASDPSSPETGRMWLIN